MGEESHLAILGGRFDEHVDTEVRNGQFTFDLGAGIMSVLAVEIERGCLRDAGGIGHTEYLEVVILIEPVTGNRFGEAHGDIILERQDAVGGACLAEEYRRAGVLRTANDGR